VTGVLCSGVCCVYRVEHEKALTLYNKGLASFTAMKVSLLYFCIELQSSNCPDVINTWFTDGQLQISVTKFAILNVGNVQVNNDYYINYMFCSVP